jgi:replicative DNA helicase
MNDAPIDPPDPSTPEEGPSGVKKVTAEEFQKRLQDENDWDPEGGNAPAHRNLLLEDEILGNILYPGERDRMSEFVALGLKPEHFSSRSSQEVYIACLVLREQGVAPSIGAVSEVMRQAGTLQILQGREEFLFGLFQVQYFTPRKLTKQVNDLIELSKHRRLTVELEKHAALMRVGDVAPRILISSLRTILDYASKAQSKAETISGLIEQMGQEGPLIHEPTGLMTLDGLTMNGPVYGTRWVVQGAPDAGKTALLVQWADLFMRRGIPVGFLAIDEEPIDLLTRLVQRAGFTRTEAEKRDPKVLTAMRNLLEEFPIRFYDADFSIEAAAADLRNHFPDKPAAFFIDSLQTAHCDTQNDRMGLRELVTANVNAMRVVTKRYKPMAVIATSEMTREAYRNEESKKATDKMSTGKESGKIEYGAKVLLSLTSVTGKPDVVELEVTKNKHGPSRVRFYLKIDRVRQELAETEAPGEVEDVAPRPDLKQILLLKDCVALVEVLLRQPGLSRRKLHAELRNVAGEDGFSDNRFAGAVQKLAWGLVTRKAKKGQADEYFLFGHRIPGDVTASMEETLRAEAYASKPPAEASAKNDAADSTDVDEDLE